jgi:hypothetical protein
LTVPEASRLFGVEERREDPRIFGATRASFFQFHSQSGALLWHIPFISEENPSDWTNASSNGDAVFVYFDVPGSEGVLKRIPIINTEHN